MVRISGQGWLCLGGSEHSETSSPRTLLGSFFIWALVPSAGSDRPMAHTQWQEEPLAAADTLPGQLHGIVFTS